MIDMDLQVSYSSDYVNSSSHIDARMGCRSRSYSMKRTVESSVHYATKDDIAQKQEELKSLRIKLARLQASLGITGSERYESRRTVDDLDYISHIIDEVAYKIECCDDFIRNAHIIDPANRNIDIVSVLCNVKVLNLKGGNEMCFRIVGCDHHSVGSGNVSCMSPVGKSLMGHRTGDIVTVDVPAGKPNLKVLEIS